MPNVYPNQINDALQHPELSDAFRTYLQSSDNEIQNGDNLKFRDAAAKFKQDAANPNISDNDLRTKFSDLTTGEMSAVNISDNLSAATYLRPPNSLSRADMTALIDEADQEVVATLGRDAYPRFVADQQAKNSPALQKLNDNLQVKFTDIARLEEQKRKVGLSSAGDRAEQVAALQGDIDTATQRLRDKGISAGEISEGVDLARVTLQSVNDVKVGSHASDRRLGVDNQNAAANPNSVRAALGGQLGSNTVASGNKNAVKGPRSK